MSEDETRPILCGECHVSPEVGPDRDGEKWARCPGCGKEDRVEDIMREAGKHLAAKTIGEILRGAASGSSSVTVKRGPYRYYRWITG